MTYNPLDEKTAEFDSGVVGWAGQFNVTTPDFSTSETSGGGSVSAGLEGTAVSPGTTSGDTAELRGPRASAGDHFQNWTQKCVIIFDQGNHSTDDFFVGLNRNGGGEMGIDLLNDQIIIGGSTFSWNADPGGDSGAIHLVVWTDNGQDSKVVTRSGAGTQEERTSDGTFQGRFNDYVTSNSNGGGETLKVRYIRHVFFPPGLEPDF